MSSGPSDKTSFLLPYSTSHWYPICFSRIFGGNIINPGRLMGESVGNKSNDQFSSLVPPSPIRLYWVSFEGYFFYLANQHTRCIDKCFFPYFCSQILLTPTITGSEVACLLPNVSRDLESLYLRVIFKLVWSEVNV